MINSEFILYSNLIFILLSIIISFRIFSKGIKELDLIILIIFSILYISLFGFRDLSVGSDTYSYIKNYTRINESTLSFQDASDTIFYVLSKLNNYLGFDSLNILFIIASIYIINILFFTINY